jgi:hypothetical protein
MEIQEWPLLCKANVAVVVVRSKFIDATMEAGNSMP